MPPKGRSRARKRHVGYVGFLDYQPHVELEAGSGGPRTMTVYLSQRAAKRAYADVRTVLLVFDAEDKGRPRARRGR